MSVLNYFEKVNTQKILSNQNFNPDQLASIILTDIESLDDLDIVIFNVEEDRGSINNSGCGQAGEEIRKSLYQLYRGNYKIRLADLGTIKAGNSITDTYFAVQEVIFTCIKKQVLPILIGGSQDLVYANYLAYLNLEQTVNLVSIDSRFALGETDDRINSNNFFSKIILHQPNLLFNFSNLGYQTYLVAQSELKLIEELKFDKHRLGELKEDLRNAEPVLRNADFVNFNLSSIAHSFAPSNKNTSPNGITAEEACQLARYAGISDKLSSFGIFEFNPNIQESEPTAHLVAQIIWHFIDGYYNRKKDFPACNKKEYTRYTVPIEEGDQEIIFYKSPKSDRWWMEVPFQSNFSKKYERHLMVPCNYDDYQTALNNEIPERWLLTLDKLK